jgi:hypothetical protein
VNLIVLATALSLDFSSSQAPSNITHWACLLLFKVAAPSSKTAGVQQFRTLEAAAVAAAAAKRTVD